MRAQAAFSRVQIAMKYMSVIQDDANVKALAGLALASAVVLFGSIEYVGVHVEAMFALITGLISLVLATLMYYLVDRKMIGKPAKKALAIGLGALWLAAAAVLTFDGPFNITGNGYFGTWLACLCAVSFAYQELCGGSLPIGSHLRRSFAFEPIDDSPPPCPPTAHEHTVA